MAFSGISILSPLFFVVYFFILFVFLSIYRIIIRRSLIGYCAKGKHKRYAVFIGGGNNMRHYTRKWKVLWHLFMK